MSYCWLREAAREENLLTGHALSCGYGAGADCDCHKGRCDTCGAQLSMGDECADNCGPDYVPPPPEPKLIEPSKPWDPNDPDSDIPF